METDEARSAPLLTLIISTLALLSVSNLLSHAATIHLALNSFNTHCVQCTRLTRVPGMSVRDMYTRIIISLGETQQRFSASTAWFSTGVANIGLHSTSPLGHCSSMFNSKYSVYLGVFCSDAVIAKTPLSVFNDQSQQLLHRPRLVYNPTTSVS